MKFARNIQLQLRNRNLIWLNSNIKTCHRCGKTDHLVKECKHIKEKSENKKREMIRRVNDNVNKDIKNYIEMMNQTIIDQYDFFKKEIESIKKENGKFLEDLECKLMLENQ